MRKLAHNNVYAPSRIVPLGTSPERKTLASLNDNKTEKAENPLKSRQQFKT